MTAERVAVVFIHGQGQQTPMTDVLDLARSIWRTDEVAAGGASDLAPVYSVPVYDHDTSDQRRVITQETPRPEAAGGGKIKVDFYQLYWADLMTGNRFTHLWSWFVALVKKDPKSTFVPQPLRPVRALTLGIARGAALWGVILAGLLVADLTGPQSGESFLLALIWAISLGAFWLAIGAVGFAFGATRKWPSGLSKRAALFVQTIEGLGAIFTILPALFVLVLGAIGIWFGLGKGVVTPADAIALVFLAVAAWALPMVILNRWLDTAFLLGLCLIFGCCVVGPFAGQLQPQGPAAQWPEAGSVIGRLSWIQTLVAAVQDHLGFQPSAHQLLDYALGATLVPAVFIGAMAYMLYRSFLLPVMTESARLFTPSPSNVPNQDAIRKRGLKLLEDLHESKENYDRIVVLAHSLGTAVGYGLLTYYWGKVNDSLDHANTASRRAEVETAAEALVEEPEPSARDDAALAKAFPAWRAAVRNYGTALREKTLDASGKLVASPWRVSDFITIGSPLTYAAFLMEESDGAFRDQVATYRRYAACPPQPLKPGASGFTLPDGRPHHAALFAATCWTNLYFPNRGLVWGDIIGGEVAGDLGGQEENGTQPPKLGRGVLDVELEHDRQLGWFTHNDYWPWPLWARKTPTKDPPEHIRQLRRAFHFFEGAAEADGALLSKTGR